MPALAGDNSRMRKAESATIKSDALTVSRTTTALRLARTPQSARLPSSGTLHASFPRAGDHQQASQQLRQPEPPVPARPVAPRGRAARARHGPRRAHRRGGVVRFGACNFGAPSTRRWRAGGVDVRRRRGRERVDAFRGSPVHNNAGRRPSRSRCRTSSRTARPSARCRPRRRRVAVAPTGSRSSCSWPCSSPSR